MANNKPLVPQEPAEPEIDLAEPVAPVAEEPAAPADSEPATPTEPAEPIAPKEPEDVDPVVPEKRPVAYIPLKKYHAEKAEWEKKVAELTDLATKKPDANGAPAQVDAAAVQAYADKYGLEPQEVNDLIALLPKPESGPTLSTEELAAFRESVSSDRQRKAEAFEIKDWSDNAVPTLKELFPAATEEQIKEAQKFLDPIAHSEQGVNDPYDVLVFKNRQELASIFSKEAPATPKDKATLERGKTGTGNPSRLTVKDFAGPTSDFSLINDLSDEDKNELVKGFEGQTYKRYLQYVAANTPLEVNRGGRRIQLK